MVWNCFVRSTVILNVVPEGNERDQDNEGFSVSKSEVPLAVWITRIFLLQLTG